MMAIQVNGLGPYGVECGDCGEREARARCAIDWASRSERVAWLCWECVEREEKRERDERDAYNRRWRESFERATARA